MSDPLGPRRPSKPAIRRRMNDRDAYRGVGRWRVVHGHGAETVALAKVERSEFGLADADCVLKHGLEYGLQLARRRTDDAEDFRSRGLLLERFAQLVE